MFTQTSYFSVQRTEAGHCGGQCLGAVGCFEGSSEERLATGQNGGSLGLWAKEVKQGWCDDLIERGGGDHAAE